MNYALTETFRDPACYIEEFAKSIKIGELTIDDKKDNIVKFQAKSETLKEEDYDY
ncbi:hypothetical protein KFZ58_07825 [Virgibacillus sp. NKC19-16]|uniref:hypothetical protein n=1 Tax=Virgibacillus salidurans TaxID=2831673 RepID=UPI001F17674E|nr:hypothetical protein [Virgibacillus sp. NKC19-16]UJL47753.1 hypothetical protein KFZ58_07825 [Virgibacillus sp. NKC19-16]